LHESEIEMIENNMEDMKTNYQQSLQIHTRRINVLEKEQEKLRSTPKKVVKNHSELLVDPQKIISELQDLLRFGEAERKSRDLRLTDKTAVLEEKVLELEKAQAKSLGSKRENSTERRKPSTMNGEHDADEIGLLKQRLTESKKELESLKNLTSRQQQSKRKPGNPDENFDHGDVIEELCSVRKQCSDVTLKYNKLKEKHCRKVSKIKKSLDKERLKNDENNENLTKELEVARCALQAELSWKKTASDLIRRSEKDRRDTIGKLDDVDRLFRDNEKILEDTESKCGYLQEENKELKIQLETANHDIEKLKRKLEEVYQQDSSLDSTGESLIHVIAPTVGHVQSLGGALFDDSDDVAEANHQRALQSGEKFSNYLRITPEVMTSLSPR